jgi:hypothetical protein
MLDQYSEQLPTEFKRLTTACMQSIASAAASEADAGTVCNNFFLSKTQLFVLSVAFLS